MKTGKVSEDGPCSPSRTEQMMSPSFCVWSTILCTMGSQGKVSSELLVIICAFWKLILRIKWLCILGNTQHAAWNVVKAECAAFLFSRRPCINPYKCYRAYSGADVFCWLKRKHSAWACFSSSFFDGLVLKSMFSELTLSPFLSASYCVTLGKSLLQSCPEDYRGCQAAGLPTGA